MEYSNVIITKKKGITNQYSFEAEIGLSTYDLALISINKLIERRELAKKETLDTTHIF